MIITRQVPAINLIYSRSKKSGIWPCQIWQYHRFAPYILACQTRTKATTLCCADFLIAPDRTSVSDTPKIAGSSCRKVWCADHNPTLSSTGTAHRPAPQTSWIPLCSWIYSPQLSQVRAPLELTNTSLLGWIYLHEPWETCYLLENYSWQAGKWKSKSPCESRHQVLVSTCKL